ncbi:MAG TPA: type II toxin-antitoxin system VapC family toxin [Caulobacteraceae bacterium]|nr:type II toxin-antitoxin system VapC family toxin [Caulobacteraceae bacterium]
MLDTHLLLWAAASESVEGAMSTQAAALIDDASNDLLFSAASIWEIAIKSALGRDDFRADPHAVRRGLIDNGYIELPITSEHAAAVGLLPPIHKDPFDRMLLAQARVEGVELLTADTQVAAYGAPARLA